MLEKCLCNKEISYIKYDGLFIQILPRPPIISDGCMAAVTMTTRTRCELLHRVRQKTGITATSRVHHSEDGEWEYMTSALFRLDTCDMTTLKIDDITF